MKSKWILISAIVIIILAAGGIIAKVNSLNNVIIDTEKMNVEEGPGDNVEVDHEFVPYQY